MQLTAAFTSAQVIRFTQPMQHVPVHSAVIPSGAHMLSMQLSDGIQNCAFAQAS